MLIFILITSALLQLVAVVLAIRLIRVSGSFIAWFILAAAFFVQFVRRSYTLYEFLFGGSAHLPDLVSESLGLLISLLMVIGIGAIGPVISSLQAVIVKSQREEKENLFKGLLLDAAADSIIVADLSGRIVFANKAAEALRGYAGGELTGKDLHKLTTPEYAQLLNGRVAELNQKGELTYESAHYRHDGSSFPIEIHARLIKIDGKKLVLRIGRDITERKRMERNIMAEKELSEHYLNIAEVILVAFDDQARITMINRKGRQLLGYELGELLGKDWFKVCLPPEEYEQVFAVYKKIIVGEIKPFEYYENSILTKNGEKRLVAWHNTLLTDENGRITGTLSSGEDITERKRAEEEIALNAQRLETLLRLNQMGEASLKEITNFALEEAVRMTQSTIGYLAFLNEDESVLTMHSWSKTAMAECATIEKPIVYPVVKTGLWGEAVRQRQAVITNDYAAANPLKKGVPQGHVALKRHMNVPVFDGSRIVIVAGVGNKSGEYDQGDVKQLTLLMEGMWRMLERQRARVKEQELARALEIDRLKSLFIASMSHELRTPLNSIIGFTGLLLQGMAGGLNEEQQKQLGMVKSSGHHLLALINDVIDVTKIEAEKIDLTIEPFELARLVEEVKDSFAVAVADKGLALTIDQPDKMVIKSDQRRVRQIIMNLVSNAVKFTEKGEIGIRVAAEGERISIAVKDTGTGIKAEDMAKLFKQFSRIIVEGQPLREGTGLGLCLSQKLAGILGGEIRAAREFEKGSEFTFTLPLEYKGAESGDRIS